jgi:NitT/TauT family transport system permease protein
VISERLASNDGFGNLMLQVQAPFQVPLIFPGLATLAIDGVAMCAVMAILEHRMAGWARRSGFAQN